MFYSLTGRVLKTDLSSVAIECGGVGFRCQVSYMTLQDIDPSETVTLYTYLNVREDAMELFGFSTEYELEWFKLLISVSGVGPKAALAVLSQYLPDRLALLISAGDSKAITKAQGVGPKIAQRIILELKDKVKTLGAVNSGGVSVESVELAADSSNTSEAIAALTMLGYTQTDAAVAVSKIDPSLNVEDIIKQALKLLSRQV
ncbi:MAG: Holliday junction branch migration protein RuvA [Clostridia bacterium]|nr:Holliday junction branch migration protein RuvA [Clostridia bacterium]MBR6651142.1 Holliday junction branch migration protein RuvA [Clostridia bacterium]